MGERLDEFDLVNSYKYVYPDGELIMEHRRYEDLNPITRTRRKTFRYWDPRRRRMQKPPESDELLYRLPDVLAAIDKGMPIHWTEGEKDADALWAHGAAATSHHQGAGHANENQAAWLTDARQVVLWVDKDRERPEVGAYDACIRYNALIHVGVEPERVRFVKARGVRNKDAFDHLATGYTPEQALSVDRDRLVAVARLYTPSAGRKLGYRRG